MVASNNELSQFISNQVPPKCQRRFPAALEKAHQAVKELVTVEEIFTTPAGFQHYGYLVNLSFELYLEREVQRLIKNGWAVESGWYDYPTGSGKNYRILTSEAMIIPCRLRSIKAFPRKAMHREKQRQNNYPMDSSRQQKLSLPGIEPRREIDAEGKYLILMPHGHKGPNFLHLAVPHSEINVYSFYTPNLMDQLTIVEDDLPPVEGLDAEADATVREELRKVIRDGKLPG